ncbi:MAG: hypothetical protein DI535_03865 [Citrobacter freundii]|nr:MAG: hypothetical protein DI535_03865 [Citrobacter freundii]
MQAPIDFTPQELEENKKAFTDLVDLVRSEDAILMAGAGCSGAIYPPWGRFVDELEAAAKEADPTFNADKGNFLTFADAVKTCLGDDYNALIYRTFEPKPGNTHLPFHESLCRLPFKAITTTNYDIVLENALSVVNKSMASSLHFEDSTKQKIHDFLSSLNYSKSPRRFVAHLHGIFDAPNSIVLGGKEYSSKYGFELGKPEDTLFDQINKEGITKEHFSDLLIKYGYEWPLRRKLLWSLLATRRIVFIGFSMTDPYFIKMLEFVREDLSTYRSETHFLVLRATASTLQSSLNFAADLKRRYGIQTVFFLEGEHEYDGLGKFISELENEISPLIETISPKIVDADPAQTTEAAPTAVDAEYTKHLFTLAKQQHNDEN